MKSVIEAYIAAQDEAIRPQLQKLYSLLKTTLPEAEERISYAMPTFWKGRNIIHFAAMKGHIGLYPGGEATTVFADKLKGYKTTKGSIHIKYGIEMDEALISEIALWCWEKYRR